MTVKGITVLFLFLCMMVSAMVSCTKQQSPAEQVNTTSAVQEVGKAVENAPQKESKKPLENEQSRPLTYAQLMGQPKDAPNIAGELYGVPVPIGNYYFSKKVVVTFSAPWRGTPQTKEELEDLVWQELLFSYEAFRRGIEASQDEIDEEIAKMLKADEVEFNWKEDTQAYQEWVQAKLNESIEAFENQMEHLVKLHKLRQEIIESMDPEVTEDEAYNKFLNEYNTLLVELVQCDKLSEAEEFYKEVIQPFPEGSDDKLIWKDLVLSFEAFSRGLEVSNEEIDKAIDVLLRTLEARFRWKQDAEKYSLWLQETFGLTEQAFREHIRFFVRADALLQKIFLGEQPKIDEDQYRGLLEKRKQVSSAYSAFFDKYKVTAQQLGGFTKFSQAQQFYKKIKREASAWEGKKRKQPERFKQPGFVALDFLINIWGFQKEDAYKMMEMPIGTIYKPSPIYKGHGVFKILKQRIAEPEKFQERRQYYFDRVKSIKKMQGYKEWVEDFKEKAEVKVYLEK